MKVQFTPEVQVYFQKLSQILFEKGYFSFRDTAKKYVKELFDDIEENLPKRLHKPAPPYYDKYGKNLYYAVFKKTDQHITTPFFQSTLKMKKLFF